MVFFKFKQAIRLVNASGSVIAGPLKLWLPDADAQGLFLANGTPKYAPEFLGPYMNAGYQERWIFLGYRPHVDLSFDLAMSDGKSGLANLLAYFDAAVKSETYCALQFNAFAETSSTWRGMYPTNEWSPQPARGKQRLGYELTVSLRAKDLIAAPGDWSAGVW